MEDRVRKLNDAPERAGARYILYWSQMNRRVEGNHALAYAVQLANERRLPVLVYEGLTYTYPHANDRLHTFMLEAVPQIEKQLHALGIGYVHYLRRTKSDPHDVLYRLAQDAAFVVTDDYPVFIAAGHNARVPLKIGVACAAVDSSCVVPMNRIPARQYAAYTIRPRIRELLPEYLKPLPLPRPERLWNGQWNRTISSFHTRVTPQTIRKLVSECDIDHRVPVSLAFRGGRLEAEERLEVFVRDRLRRYARERNQPSRHATSDLSPYLHFGQISSLEIALRVREHAARHKLMAEEFLEELIVRRELAFNFARFAHNVESLNELPAWCLGTIGKHRKDKREPSYTHEQFELGLTHDRLWNAAQKELLLNGKIHGYYRMYWGKKIIEWSPTPEQALRSMLDLHDRYALDGRDPNTYTNILWCFGLHDRAWPERPIFGKLRYLSLDGMRRKTDVEAYCESIESLAADHTGT